MLENKHIPNLRCPPPFSFPLGPPRLSSIPLFHSSPPPLFSVRLSPVRLFRLLHSRHRISDTTTTTTAGRKGDKQSIPTPGIYLGPERPLLCANTRYMILKLHPKDKKRGLPPNKHPHPNTPTRPSRTPRLLWGAKGCAVYIPRRGFGKKNDTKQDKRLQ